MIIFGPTVSLQRNFECLINRPEWRQALEDPFSLLVVALDDLHRQVDEARAKLHEALRSAEDVSHRPFVNRRLAEYCIESPKQRRTRTHGCILQLRSDV